MKFLYAVIAVIFYCVSQVYSLVQVLFVRHLDNHSLWVPNGFAVRCFKVIMYSVQVSCVKCETLRTVIVVNCSVSFHFISSCYRGHACWTESHNCNCMCVREWVVYCFFHFREFSARTLMSELHCIWPSLWKVNKLVRLRVIQIQALLCNNISRELRIVFFAFESNRPSDSISNRPSDSISNRIFESNRPYIPRKP